MRPSSRLRAGMLLAATCAVVVIGGSVASASEQGCTGQTASTVAPVTVPFGTTVVAPTAMAVENFGQEVIVPEATAAHDDCP